MLVDVCGMLQWSCVQGHCVGKAWDTRGGKLEGTVEIVGWDGQRGEEYEFMEAWHVVPGDKTQGPTVMQGRQVQAMNG